VRIEQLYPFPVESLRHALASHPGAEVVWCQEEPENMGPACWLDRRLEAVAGTRVPIVARPAAAPPAAGYPARHEAERQAVLDAALG
jgi:2-oxoglutarate dehydrogenase E1 component